MKLIDTSDSEALHTLTVAVMSDHAIMTALIQDNMKGLVTTHI